MSFVQFEDWQRPGMILVRRSEVVAVLEAGSPESTLLYLTSGQYFQVQGDVQTVINKLVTMD